MSDVKFTKGPWHVGSDFDNGEYPITAIYDERSIYVVSASGDREVISTEERRANARLIATAPELYEMVKSLLNESHPEKGVRAMVSHELADKARELLSKSNPK